MDIFVSKEYLANLKRIEEAYPDTRLLSKKRMRKFLGGNDIRILEQFGIKGKITRESFAVRLTEGGKEDEER